LLTALAFGAGAETPLAVVVNDEAVSFDVPPRIESGRVLVPLRFASEALGATVEWNAQMRQVNLVLGEKSVTLTVDATSAQANGRQVALEVPPRIEDGRLLVPLRFFAEALGAGVVWEAETRTVRITLKKTVTGKEVSIGAIILDAASFQGRTVTIRGQYQGWRADPQGPATRFGPPVTRSDWGMGDATGSIYVTGAEPALDPMDDVGRKVGATGVVRRTANGIPYLQATSAWTE